MTMIDQPAPVADPPLPLLVTGVAGVAGFNAFHYFQERYPGQVFGTRRVDNWPLSGPGIHGCDVEDYEGFAALFEKHRFQSVLNCEGTCKLKSCELDPAMAQRVNVVGVQNLLKLVHQYQARMVHLSIDLVFSGTGQGGHVEQDATDPVTVYGRTMVEAEELMVQENPAACILRMSLPMGVSHNGHAGAIDWIQSRFAKSKPATLYYDEIRTPTYTDCLNRLFQRVLAADLRGLYHAGGPRCLSLYQIAQVVNRIGGYAPEHLQGCYREEAGPIPPRAGNVTMNSDRLAAAIGFQPFDPWPYHESHLPTHRDWHRERPGNETGSPELLAQVLYRNPRYS
ncbi:MAG: sugar nucleotide-binding protein [Planctomycetota bacterium]|nr:sugar nucleotide-binding protein [Planctomycetota bacterium]